MKTLYIAIIVGISVCVLAIFGILFFNMQSKPMCQEGILPNGTCAGPAMITLGTNDLDLSNPTTENPLGIQAKVAMEKDTLISCIRKCDIPPTPHLILISEKGAQFVGYQVCDGASCKKDVLDNSLYAHLAQVPQNYSGAVGLEASHINLGNLPWSVGDTVHILVKAFPVTLQPNNIVIREPEKTMVIDFGESKIIGNYNTTNVSTIIIPKGSSDLGSGKNYEPRYLLVVLGINNTVKWINEDDMANTIVADTHNQPDPLFEKGPYGKGMILHGKSFNFTFTNIGEYQYDTEPHPWLYGWVLVLPQSPENATQTVIVNDTKIPGPCEIFALPCPNSTSFTAQKFGPDVYIEKVTINGYDKYAIVHPSTNCVYPPSYNGNKTCRNPDDLAILRLVGVDTSIPQENLGITINGLNSTYAMGDPVNFGIKVKGYGHCDFPSVLVIRQGVIVWQSKTAWVSCPSTMSQIDDKYTMGDLGGPFYLNQSGTYTVHVGYASNMTEEQFNIASLEGTSKTNPIVYTKNNDPFGIIALVIYHPPNACLGPCPPNTFYLKTNSNSTAYLIGYNICDGDSCTKKDDLSILLPITDVLKPDFKMIPLPEDLHWKYGDAVHIEVKISSTADSKTALLIDYGNSTIVP